jgi:hypothetical protein
MTKNMLFLCLVILCGACTTSTPKYIDNVCEIFREKEGWYDDTKRAKENWGVPIHVIMAIIHQESRFVADAQPPRPWLLGIIPWFRSSSAYGYAQAQQGTWQDYLKNGGHWGGDRDDFSDASDFVGWYCHNSHKQLGISKWDTEKLYLAYHEGWGGYRRQTYLQKKWLMRVAKKVNKKAGVFRAQLTNCEEELESTGWFF